MLKKFVTIKNVGKFRNHGVKGDIEFRKLSLIYGENARGKTTLCSILRSLQSGDSSFITEKKTAGSKEAPEVHVLTDSTSITFKHGAWSSKYEKIAIFDSSYVAENVYSGDFIEHDHRKRLYQVTIGSEGVKLAQEIDLLDTESRTVASKLKEKKDLLGRYFRAPITLEGFLKIPEDTQVENKIAEKNKEIEAIQNSQAIKLRPTLSKITFPTPPADIETLLAQTLTDVSKQAEGRVRAHIEKHSMGANGPAWISDGLKYVKIEECPFCSQKISENDLLTAYRTFFSAEYQNLKISLSDLRSRISDAYSERKIGAIKTTLVQNKADADWWNTYTKLELPVVSGENEIAPVLQRLAIAFDSLVEMKLKEPLEPLNLNQEANQALQVFAELKLKIEDYNQRVVAGNLEIEKVKQSVASGDLVKVRKELETLQLGKTRHSQAVAAICTEYLNQEIEKQKIETDKNGVKKKLDAYGENVLKNYQDGINALLARFGASFKIAGVKQQYVGGTPSSTFQIELNGIPFDLGDSRTPRGIPCFRTIMSSADKNTLALAFFLVQLFQRSDLSELTVVFDDPFTSLDRFRKNFTKDQIRTIEQKVRQVIVLSHEPTFLELISKDFDSGKLRVLQLQRQGVTDAVIREWDLKSEVASGFSKDIEKLISYYHGLETDARDVVRRIRPVLETQLRTDYPGQFGEKEWFGDMLGKIKGAVPPSVLVDEHSKIADLESLNDYSKRYHHADGQLTGELIEDGELHSYVGQTLKIIRRT